MPSMAQCLTKSVYFQQTAVYGQRKGHFNRSRLLTRASQEQESQDQPKIVNRRAFAGTLFSALSLFAAGQAIAGPSPTRVESKQNASKERAAKMKEKVEKAKKSGGYIE